jgi:hypothetical protein
VGKFLNPSGRLECRQGQVGLCQGTAKLSAVFGCPFFGCVGRPTLAGNGFRLCEVADFQHKCSFEKLSLNLAQNCHRSTAPAILQNRCSSDTFGEPNLY